MGHAAISEKTRVEYFDILRIAAALAVVVIHVAAQNWPHVAVGSLAWHLFNFWDSITRWGAPVFIMISGALFLDGRHTIRKIVTKNVFRMVVAFLLWSGIYVLVYLGMGEYSAELAIWRFFTGHYHMWFLWTITGLYLAVPVLRQIALSESATRYFLLLAFVFNSMLPMVAEMIGMVFSQSGALLTEMLASFRFDFPKGYVFYFLGGYYLHKRDISKKWQRWIYLVGIGSALFTFTATYAASMWMGEGVGLFYNDWSVGSVGMSIAVFVFGKYHCDKTSAVVKRLSRYCFGVYLVHPLILELLQKLCHVETLSFHPFVAVPALAAIVAILSFGISAMLHQIPVVKKYAV